MGVAQDPGTVPMDAVASLSGGRGRQRGPSLPVLLPPLLSLAFPSPPLPSPGNWTQNKNVPVPCPQHCRWRRQGGDPRLRQGRKEGGQLQERGFVPQNCSWHLGGSESQLPGPGAARTPGSQLDESPKHVSPNPRSSGTGFRAAPLSCTDFRGGNRSGPRASKRQAWRGSTGSHAALQTPEPGNLAKGTQKRTAEPAQRGTEAIFKSNARKPRP